MPRLDASANVSSVLLRSIGAAGGRSRWPSLVRRASERALRCISGCQTPAVYPDWTAPDGRAAGKEPGRRTGRIGRSAGAYRAERCRFDRHGPVTADVDHPIERPIDAVCLSAEDETRCGGIVNVTRPDADAASQDTTFALKVATRVRIPLRTRTCVVLGSGHRIRERGRLPGRTGTGAASAILVGLHEGRVPGSMRVLVSC
jgi:hypothetical protein